MKRRLRGERKRARDARLAAAYEAGEPVDVLAKRFKLSPATVRSLACILGATKPWNTAERNEKIRELFAGGWGFQRIADHYGVSRQRIEQIVRPHIDRARRRATYAKKSGELTPSDSCALCGLRGPTESHHPRYDRPLEVTWLCRDCHAVADVRRREVSGVAA